MENNMESVEKKRKEIITDLLVKGKKKGSLSIEEITEELFRVQIDKDQVEAVYDLLVSSGIEIIEDKIDDEGAALTLPKEETEKKIPLRKKLVTLTIRYGCILKKSAKYRF